MENFFIPRDLNSSHEYFEHELAITGIEYFKSRGFTIFDRWMKGDDTSQNEFIALLKKENK